VVIPRNIGGIILTDAGDADIARTNRQLYLRRQILNYQILSNQNRHEIEINMAHILLVDDDENFRTMLRITLQRLGHQITEATDGSMAIKLHAQNNYDAVMMDLIMPDKEGMETIVEMRKDHPDTKIIAMSGGGRMNAKDILTMAKAVGADQILAKPFENEKLIDTLKSLGIA
jgi:CheY-like chemotaxis protein